jgi:hypothetical protein
MSTPLMVTLKWQPPWYASRKPPRDGFSSFPLQMNQHSPPPMALLRRTPRIDILYRTPSTVPPCVDIFKGSSPKYPSKIPLQVFSTKGSSKWSRPVGPIHVSCSECPFKFFSFVGSLPGNPLHGVLASDSILVGHAGDTLQGFPCNESTPDAPSRSSFQMVLPRILLQRVPSSRSLPVVPCRGFSPCGSRNVFHTGGALRMFVSRAYSLGGPIQGSPLWFPFQGVMSSVSPPVDPVHPMSSKVVSPRGPFHGAFQCVHSRGSPAGSPIDRFTSRGPLQVGPPIGSPPLGPTQRPLPGVRSKWWLPGGWF